MGKKPTIDEDKIGTHTDVTSIFIIDPLASQHVHGNPHFLHMCIENNMLGFPGGFAGTRNEFAKGYIC